MQFRNSDQEQGGFLPLPASRAFIVDYLHFAARVPSHPLVRNCDLAEVDRLRKASQSRIGWAALFIRAYALMAKEHPALRQRICDWPWMRLYQKPSQGAKVCVKREYKGDPWLFFFGIDTPDQRSLLDIQAELDHAKHSPVETVRPFYLQTIYSRFPRMLRRWLWFVALNFPNLGGVASKGTFGVTSVASLNAVSINPYSSGIMVLTYGPIEQDGQMRVTLVYDHRLFDGGTVAQFLGELEDVMNTQIVAELSELQLQRLAA